MRSIAVVGLGAIGAQVAWQLSRSTAVDLHGYDAHTRGNPLGASGGENRIFRTVQYESEHYFALLERANELWSELEHDVQQQIRVITSGLVIGSRNAPVMATAELSIDQLDLDCTMLDAAELRARFPQQAYLDDDIGILDHGAGIIRPELTNLATLRAAETGGATVHVRTPVTAVGSDSTSAHITTAAGLVRYDHVVVCCGAWTSHLVPEIASLVTPRKLVSAWYFPRVSGALAGLPPFVRTSPDRYYGVPSGDGVSLKLGVGGTANAEILLDAEPDRSVSDTEAAAFDHLLAQYFPGLDPDPLRMDTYFEGYTEDSIPLAGYVPGHGQNVSVLAGFSGHGFKLAPAIGQIGAALALHEPPPLAIDFMTAWRGDGRLPENDKRGTSE